MKRKLVAHSLEQKQGAPALQLTATDKGIVEAYVSVFGNVDLQGDRVMPTAFDKSLAKWRASGDPIPVVFSHQWGDANSIIGSADPYKALSDEHGLRLVMKFNMGHP